MVISYKSQKGSYRTGSFELGFQIEGQGIPAIVIGSSIFYPRTFAKELSNQIQMIFLDHRGFARASDHVVRADFGLDLILADIDAVRTHLGLQKMIIIGHSGHGYLALEYAKRYPERVTHVVMIATGPSHGRHMATAEKYWQEAVCPERKVKFAQDMALLPQDIEREPDRRFIHFCIRQRAKAWYDINFDPQPLWQGVQVHNLAFDYLFGEVFRDIEIEQGLDQLRKPVFLALGRYDYQVAPYATWEPYRKFFYDLTLRVFDHSAHTPQLEESSHFNREILEWLKART